MRKILYTGFIAMAGLLSSCNNDYMERLPDTSLTESTVFTNYNTFKTYAWSLYGTFTDHGNILRTVGTSGYGSSTSYRGDVNAGYLMYKQGNGNNYAFQNISSVATGNGWNFDYIRKVNVMLDNIDQANMTAAEKAHWRSVGYFFRSFRYMELIARFGDVTWINRALKDTDTDIIYGPRTPRKEVADSVLANLIYAEKNIKEKGDGKNTINVHVVRALLSRFCLFEGTWRKYHELGDHEKYLQAAVTYSEKLMNDFPTLHPNYGEVFTSDLANVQGVILYKEFVAEELTNYVLCHVERTSSHNIEMPQHMVDMYLCKDGKPISTSQQYMWKQESNNTMFATFTNRDRRLLETVAPPYRIKQARDAEGRESWVETDKEEDSKFMKIMGTTKVTGYGGGKGEAGKHKVLPLMNWSASVLKQVPHFFNCANGQGFMVARGGYYVYKYYNVWDDSRESMGTSDVPIFHMGEVLLNYAEAKYELDEFDQGVADKSINLLRKRADIATMTVASIKDDFDPKRDQSVNPVLWEIRRERIVELMGEGSGFYDIRRWKKADWFVNKMQYGQWVNKQAYLTWAEAKGGKWEFADLDTGFKSDATEEGYLYMYNDPIKAGKGWLDKYYLYQIPTNEIALNPNLKPNNPGWE